VRQWLLCLVDIAAQALTPVSVRRGHVRLELLQHLRQLPLKHVEFGDLLLDGVQLLRHEGVQAGTHRETLPTVELRGQRFEIGKRKP
jgi:hypothetical protein